MEAANLQIYWHESQPIYSICFSPSISKVPKLVTAGGDNKVRIWNLNFEENRKTKIETIDFLSSLNQHEQAINVVRFNHKGDILASAGDDGQLLLWKQSEISEKKFGEDDADLDEYTESWSVWKRFRSRGGGIGAYEIYDIAWSSDDNFIVTGSMDNAVRIFELSSGDCVASASDHTHYVQGVLWDPLDKFILSQSADRSVHVYEIVREASQLQLKLKNKIMKCELPVSFKEHNKLDLSNTKLSYLFHNETLPSFFRRPAISPCGNLICIPAGIFKTDSNLEANTNPELNNSVQIYTRSAISQNSNKPAMCIPFLKKPALAVGFNPNFYKTSEPSKAYIRLPYKLIFAIATANEVLIYDTENIKPVAIIGNLHYTSLTDLSWSQDGTLLMISSTDGFCSYISIEDNTFGEKMIKEQVLQLSIEGKSETDTIQNPSSMSINSEKEKVSGKQNKSDIVNILPVKRKLPVVSKDIVPKKEKYINEQTDAKEKRRIHPVHVSLE